MAEQYNNMKKREARERIKILSLVLLSVFMFSMIASFVSAAWVDKVTTFMTDQVNPVVEFLFGPVDFAPKGYYTSGEIYFVKVVVFIILVALLYFAVQKVPVFEDDAKKWLVWIISLAIGLIATRFLTTEGLVSLIWLPSGVLGISLACIFPFLIWFFFIESFQNNPMIRKIGWIFYAVVFAVMAFVRWNTTQFIGPQFNGWYYNYSMIYVITAIVSLLMVVFDKSLQAYISRSKLLRNLEGTTYNKAVELHKQAGYIRANYLSLPIGADLTWETEPGKAGPEPAWLTSMKDRKITRLLLTKLAHYADELDKAARRVMHSS